jgi:hypothetical protein
MLGATMARPLLFVVFSLLATGQTAPLTWKHAIIAMERTECFGSCPVYTVTVDETGSVVYRGQRFVRVTGEQRTTIAPATVTALVTEFRRILFFNLQSTYTANVTDGPTTYVSIDLDGVSKRVTDYMGAPAALRQLEKQIDDVTNTRHWVYLDPPAIKEIQASAKPMSQVTLDSELEQSVSRDDVETAQALIAAGASAIGEPGKRTPLFRVRSVAMVHALVAAGANVDSLDAGGTTALVQAAEYQDIDIVDALLKAGAKVDGPEGLRMTPLIRAAGAGKAATVEMLLKAGADPRARDASGKTALDWAGGPCQMTASLSARMRADLTPVVTINDCDTVMALLKGALAK